MDRVRRFFKHPKPEPAEPFRPDASFVDAALEIIVVERNADVLDAMLSLEHRMQIELGLGPSAFVLGRLTYLQFLIEGETLTGKGSARLAGRDPYRIVDVPVYCDPRKDYSVVALPPLDLIPSDYAVTLEAGEASGEPERRPPAFDPDAIEAYERRKR